jgi:outer membrane protein OmpA-like peptidoglycan-associated protein
MRHHLSAACALTSMMAFGAPTLSVRGAVGLGSGVSPAQTDRFGGGVAFAATPFLEVLPYLDLQVTGLFVVLAPQSTRPGANAGGVLSMLAGARLKRPMREQLVSPWFDVGMGPAWSGAAHLSLSASAGVSFRAKETWPVWLGLAARIEHLVKPALFEGFTSTDASLVSIGFAVEFSSGSVEDDHDHDGVLDINDACPTVFAQTDTGCAAAEPEKVVEEPKPSCNGHLDEKGTCVPYAGVRVTRTRIELDEKIFFAFGKTLILPRSDPLLSEVAKALTDNPALCVRIEGHADAKGTDAFNRQLSEGRALAVRTFLIVKGVDGARLSTKGYGSALPRDDNGSADGRDQNRRVEFVVIECEGAP